MQGAVTEKTMCLQEICHERLGTKKSQRRAATSVLLPSEFVILQRISECEREGCSSRCMHNRGLTPRFIPVWNKVTVDAVHANAFYHANIMWKVAENPSFKHAEKVTATSS